ncbi:MAG TPA: AAA family ATPase [Pyrinomonadaceae bacterium]|jgi:hypothetical protein
MIKELHLNNFRGFEGHFVPLRPSTIIIGKNNAGKSTIVESLRLISLVVTRFGALEFSNVPTWLDIPKREKGVKPSLRNIEINLESVFYRYGEPPANIQAVFDTGESITIYIGPQGDLHAVIKDAKQNPIITKGQAQKLNLSGVSILPQVAPLAHEEQILNPDYVRRSFSSSLAPLHFRNQLKLFYEEYFDKFKDLAESSWPSLRINDLEGRYRLPGDGKLSLLVQDSGFVAEVGWMGHGLQMWLQVMWFLTYASKEHTVILDEPDVYMHADLQRRLIRSLRGHFHQLIIATHSTEILAEVEPDEVLVIDRARKKSTFTTSLPAVQRVLDGIGSAHNLHLARLWSARRFLLVEGDDLALLKHFQNILFPDSNDPFGAIPNVSIGGWGGWSYVIGSSLFLKNAAGEEIITYCLLDSDYHTKEQIEVRLEEAKRHGIQLHIWLRKEIENYFIIPAAIHRLILAGTRRPDVVPSIQEVNNKLVEISENLHDDILDAMAQEYFALNKASGISKANEYARKRMASVWSALDRRLTIIPGKKFLSMMSQWIQDEFKLSFSISRLAKEIRADEVDSEVVKVISTIESHENFGL